MDDLRALDSPARARRSLALIVLALIVLAASGGIYLWRSAATPGSASPGLLRQAPTLVAITPLSDHEAWVLAQDGVSSTSVLLHTSDGGASWRQMFSVAGFGDLRFTDPRRGVLETWRPGLNPATSTPDVYSTEDGGSHWRLVTLPPVSAGSMGVPFFLDPEHGWLLAARRARTEDQSVQEETLWRTGDGGRHWETLLRIDQTHPFSNGISAADQLLSVSFGDRDTGWIVGQGIAASAVVYMTHDGGRDWVPVPLPSGLPGPAKEDLLYAGDPSVSAAGRGVLPVIDRTINHTWVYQTSDRGRTWRGPYAAPGTTSNISFVDGSVGWGIVDGVAWMTSDSGRTWLPATSLPGGLKLGAVAPVTASAAWAQGLEPDSDSGSGWAMFRTGDAGLHWTRASSPVPP